MNPEKEKLIVLYAIEEKIHSLMKCLSYFQDKNVNLPDDPKKLSELFKQRKEELEKLLNLYQKLKENPIKEKEGLDNGAAALKALENKYLFGEQLIKQSLQNISELKGELMVLSNIL